MCESCDNALLLCLNTAAKLHNSAPDAEAIKCAHEFLLLGRGGHPRHESKIICNGVTKMFGAIAVVDLGFFRGGDFGNPSK